MSRSYRTRRPAQIAASRLSRDPEGRAALPRIVVRPPAPAEVHPLAPDGIRSLLARMPEEYLYGLRRVELQTRGRPVGRPYGFYRPPEAKIVLYSLPQRWYVPALIGFHAIELSRCGALLQATGTGYWVWWADRADLAYFHYEVLLHELGHHHAHRYRTRRPVPRYTDGREAQADLHVRRLISSTFLDWWAEHAGEADARRRRERRDSIQALLRRLRRRV